MISPLASRTSLPLLLSIAGMVGWLLAPGGWLATLPLLFCSGWGLTRVLSVLDRNFGVLGSSLCCSTLVLGALALAGQLVDATPMQLGMTAHLVSVGLCVVGRIRLAAYDRWSERQPPHPDPMPWWPERTWLCLVIVAVAVALSLHVEPIDQPADGADRVDVAARAEAWLTGGEQPWLAGRELSRDTFVAAATASLSAGSGCHPLRAAQLLALTALVACLVFVAEGISRLWGNRGAALAMLAMLLGLNPLATLFMLGSAPDVVLSEHLTAGFDPAITTALSPFLEGAPLATALAFTAMLLFSTLSVLRRASTHVPRLMAVATFGLVVTDPRAAVLLLPGWFVGVLLSHLACLDSPDNDPLRGSSVHRDGDPLLLRSPFWRPALHMAVGACLGFAVVDAPDASMGLARVVAWGLVAAVGPGCLLFMPGVRHLNASPGREAYFFVGLVLLSTILGLTIHFGGDEGNLVVRLLALVLSVPAANGAMKIVEVHGNRARLLLVGLLIIVLPGPLVVLRDVNAAERPVSVDRHGELVVDRLSPDLDAALRVVDQAADRRAVLVVDPGLPQDAVPWVPLLAGRPALVLPGADQWPIRREIIANLASGDGTALTRLRGMSGLAGRALWGVHQGPSWPGFLTHSEHGSWRVERAAPPDVVLITVASLRSDRIGPAHMPSLAERADRGTRFRMAITPSPTTVPGLATLLTGLSPTDHDVRDEQRRLDGGIPTLEQHLSERGYRTAAIVALPPGTGLLAGFESRHADRTADADELVGVAVGELAAADPRPLFLWLHLSDLELPYEIPVEDRTEATGELPFPPENDPARTWYGIAAWPPSPNVGFDPEAEIDVAAGLAQYDVLVANIDKALSRLLVSVSEEDLLVVTSPHGTSLDEHQAWFHHGADLFEPSIQVPLLVCGGGLPGVDDHRLASLEDVSSLLLAGRMPSRVRVMLESDWRPGHGTGAAYPPAKDPTSRGLARRIWGERTLHAKTLLTTEPGNGREADGVSFDLQDDADEMSPRPADPYVLRRIDSWRRRGRPATLDTRRGE